MAGRIGMLGGLSDISFTGRQAVYSGGIVAGPFEGKRIFSSGCVTIGGFCLSPARIFWDTGSKQTFVFVPSLDMIDIRSNKSFPVSGIGASVTAQAYPATLDLSGGIVFHDVYVGVLPCDNPDDGLYDSADVILGMDIICRGLFRLDGEKQRFSFKVR